MTSKAFNTPLIQRSIFCLSLVLFTPLSFAIDSHKFSDSNLSIKMHNSHWNKQAITYSKKYKDADLSISLDQQQYPYLLPIIQQFSLQKNKTIAVSDGTCGVSAGKLRRKEIDMGGFCCPPSQFDRLPGLKFHTLGIASLALMANKDVPVKNISIDQAKKIFSGDISSWAEVSQNKANILAISPIVRLHCDKRPGHWKLIIPNKTDFSNNALKVGSIPSMLKRTSKVSGAVGYETLWAIDQYKDKEPVKLIKINDIDPKDSIALAKGEYPFYRTFSITTWGEEAKPLAKELIAYLIQNINTTNSKEHTLVGVDKLKQNGWKFNGDELIAEPHKPLFGLR